ncbi:PREDICTED: nucleoporin NUP53-like isoform X2 [Ceratosolen solmsi marchali]|nr:PREDICTED: nucleoporin NUP53-like isoform X2 [Ceratosolen solmsi marchali]XP_011501296.1 PREDICTED: nucleoporin NUP53-like isoform X2 [Ceratosolen solmsi marchali]XP_011501297.1 PREDICTED: nucleoporin NUP53-like isoform X2 [Ceratosolen solmsi marchali]
MEPMALGSPTTTPSQSPNNAGANSAYLPGFLLGDNNVQTRIGVITPESSRFVHASPGNSHSPVSSYSPNEYRLNRQKAMFGGGNIANISQMGIENHVGGPPIKSLYESLETRRQSLGTSYNSSINNQSMNQSRLLGAGFCNNTLNSPTCDTPINTTHNESTQGLLQWVTVFGFPTSALNTVLSHISSRVRVIDKHPAPHAQSNWIHLKCSTEQEAQRALACNGNIVSGSIMIGIIPCTDEGVILGADKECRTKSNVSARLFSTPSKGTCISGLNTSRTPVRVQNARPLVSGYNQHLNSQAVRSPENVPHKSTDLVSKTLEYVFRW